MAAGKTTHLLLQTYHRMPDSKPILVALDMPFDCCATFQVGQVIEISHQSEFGVVSYELHISKRGISCVRPDANNKVHTSASGVDNIFLRNPPGRSTPG